MDTAIEALNALRLHEKRMGYERATGGKQYNAFHTQHFYQSHAQEENQHQYHHQPQQQQRQQQQQQPEHDEAVRVLQEQYEQKVREQQDQMMRFQEEMKEMRIRFEATEQQNGFLKTALSSVDVYKHKVADQEMMIDELQNQVRQLKMTNYRLQLLVQQNEPGRDGSLRGNGGMPPSPPDIY